MTASELQKYITTIKDLEIGKEASQKAYDEGQNAMNEELRNLESFYNQELEDAIEDAESEAVNEWEKKHPIALFMSNVGNFLVTIAYFILVCYLGHAKFGLFTSGKQIALYVGCIIVLFFAWGLREVETGILRISGWFCRIIITICSILYLIMYSNGIPESGEEVQPGAGLLIFTAVLFGGTLLLYVILATVFSGSESLSLPESETEKITKEKTQKRNEIEHGIKTEYNKKLTFLIEINQGICQKLETLYSMNIIPETYRNYNALVMFCEYLETGRCENIKECMLKFDNDAEIALMHEKIDLMNARLDELERSAMSQIGRLRKEMRNNIDEMNNLVIATRKSNAQDLHKLDFCLHMHQLMLDDTVEKMKE